MLSVGDKLFVGDECGSFFYECEVAEKTSEKCILKNNYGEVFEMKLIESSKKVEEKYIPHIGDCVLVENIHVDKKFIGKVLGKFGEDVLVLDLNDNRSYEYNMDHWKFTKEVDVEKLPSGTKIRCAPIDVSIKMLETCFEFVSKFEGLNKNYPKVVVETSDKGITREWWSITLAEEDEEVSDNYLNFDAPDHY
jgi:hypothetical protein